MFASQFGCNGITALDIAPEQRQVYALGGQGDRDRPADAAAGAGNECGAAFKIQIHANSSSGTNAKLMQRCARG